jgi:hypothetical protein
MNAGWNWLLNYPYSWRFVARVLLKAAVLFLILNAGFALLGLTPVVGRASIYNGVVPGRERLPYGENPASFNLSLYDLNAMFASHTLSGVHGRDAATVLVLGDSSIWGILLDNDETLSGCLNARGIDIDGRRARFFNLGYPTMSVLKDALLLNQAMAVNPDLILWPLTLESMSRDEQLDAPLVQNNADDVRRLIATHGLALDAHDARLVDLSFAEQTLVGQRRPLADWYRLQMFGIPWAMTRIDQVYPDFTPRTNDFEADISWKQFAEPQVLDEAALALDVLDAGAAIAGDVPLLLINEPIFIADGRNSDLRYNLWYPRWAFDAYREVIRTHAERRNWWYADLWDAVPPAEFTDSPAHLTPAGSRMFCDRVAGLLEAG